MNNITVSIQEKRKLKLHNNPNHPVCQLKSHIQHYFEGFSLFDELGEVVSTKANFDDLLFPENHPARSANDTYYVDENHVLRTHTSAHQNELLRKGYSRFLATGDVYRKDTIDRTHYPVFHQMEGIKLLPNPEMALDDLKETIEGLIGYLFPGQAFRFLDDYFPFTNPSLQVEVKNEGQWMEVLGAGVIQSEILRNCKIEGSGWAFGLGIDRLLLSYCHIPDIRYLWTNDDRFLSQFRNGLANFKEYSKYPPINRDISFWVKNYAENAEQIWNDHNNFCELAREIGNDLIESIDLIDKFRKDTDVSLAYRITYRSNERTLLNEEINQIQELLRQTMQNRFDIVLR